MTRLITVANLRKAYPDGTVALHDVGLTLDTGRIMAIAGPNGAGKTTLMRIISTQLMPSGGHVEILGCDAIRNPRFVRRHLAVVPQDAAPDHQLTVWEQVFLYLLARGMGWKEARDQAERALEAVSLTAQRNTINYRLSGGQRRRVLIAMAVATRAPLLILDEPSAGLDPVARRELWGCLVGLRHGCSILLTTHSMEEAEALADQAAFIREGRIAASGSLAQLRAQLPFAEKVQIRGPVKAQALSPYGLCEPEGDRLIVYPRDPRARGTVIDMAMAAGCQVSCMPTDLGDVYFHIMRAGSPTADGRRLAS